MIPTSSTVSSPSTAAILRSLLLRYAKFNAKFEIGLFVHEYFLALHTGMQEAMYAKHNNTTESELQ
jgi:hypothetical protein